MIYILCALICANVLHYTFRTAVLYLSRCLDFLRLARRDSRLLERKLFDIAGSYGFVFSEMSVADVMIPQEKLKCDTSVQSPQSTVAEIVSGEEEPSSSFAAEKEKKVEFNLKVDSDNPCDSSENHVSARKKRNKNRKKRKWRPYWKLTWRERKELEERDSRRANRIREEMLTNGITLAPYNTTQFLMEDHNLQEPDYEHIPNGHRHKENSNSIDSSDEFYSSPEDEEEFLHQQFVETYENIHIEHLNSLSKTELVQELVNMEDKVEILEKSLEEARVQNQLKEKEDESNNFNAEAELEKIRVFREEIEKLSQENDFLWRENEKLRKCLSQKT